MGKLSIQPEQVVMISAGAAGIDRAIAETFLARDYHVHVCPRCCFSTAGRPQLSASGPLWRACLPVAGCDPAVGPRGRFRRWRIRVDRSDATHAIDAVGIAAALGRCHGGCGLSSLGAARARRLPGEASERRQPSAVRASPHLEDDLSRCGVKASR